MLAGHDVTVCTDHLQKTDRLAERLRDTEALVLIRERTAITAPLLARLPRLRLISRFGPYPHVDVAACTERGVMRCSNLQPGGPSIATAEFTWALILAAMRGITQRLASLRAGAWQCGVGHTSRGMALGIHGYGRIRREVACLGRAFGRDVVIWSGEASRQRARAEGWKLAAGQAALYAESDIVSFHLRLVDATRHVATAADHCAGGDVERGEQRCRAVPGAVVGASLDLAWAHRQQRLGEVERLDLRRLIDAEHQGGLV